ncbi:MAG: hypothetical protein QOI80_3354 [Solirubrobacteraceae bacterium]|jgi:hypothetical protein|nr:hypothetical protein [Solirubrobacteraceae bacterium]
MTAGYSGTPLPKKLGVKPGSRVLLVSAPEDLVGEMVGEGDVVADGPADVLVAFFTERAAFAAALDGLRAQMEPDAGLWIAWPKKAAKVPTDMTEDVVREVALPTGLVDNKVCAIDAVWSGLRLVIRLEHR